MFGRRRRRHSLLRQRRPDRRGAGWPETEPAEAEECPVCWGYGSVACRRCDETGDLDRTNDRIRDCPYCQGWGAVTCRACGGSGTRW